MAFSTNIKLEEDVVLAEYRKWPEFKTVPGKTISSNWVLITNDGMLLMRQTKASEGSEQTKQWRGKSLFTNNRLPLQCFVSSEPSDAPGDKQG